MVIVFSCYFYDKGLSHLGKPRCKELGVVFPGQHSETRKLRVELSKLFIKEIGKACCTKLSEKNPFLLRKTYASKMQNLSLEKVISDLKTSSPLLYSVLMTTTTLQRKRGDTKLWLPSGVIAAYNSIFQCWLVAWCPIMKGLQWLSKLKSENWTVLLSTLNSQHQTETNTSFSFPDPPASTHRLRQVQTVRWFSQRGGGN